MVSAFRTQRPHRPVLCHCVVFIDMPYRMASEQPEHLAQHLIQGMSRGANPSTYIMGVPGEIEYPSLDVAREIIRFHRDHADVYRGLVPAAHIGLVRPDALAIEPRLVSTRRTPSSAGSTWRCRRSICRSTWCPSKAFRTWRRTAG